MEPTETLTPHVLARVLAAEMVNIPATHANGQYAFDPLTGEARGWFSGDTLLVPDVVALPARCGNWQGLDEAETLEAVCAYHDIEGRITEARAAMIQ